VHKVRRDAPALVGLGARIQTRRERLHEQVRLVVLALGAQLGSARFRCITALAVLVTVNRPCPRNRQWPSQIRVGSSDLALHACSLDARQRSQHCLCSADVNEHEARTLTHTHLALNSASLNLHQRAVARRVAEKAQRLLAHIEQRRRKIRLVGADPRGNIFGCG
jgi:hypothetical protein